MHTQISVYPFFRHLLGTIANPLTQSAVTMCVTSLTVFVWYRDVFRIERKMWIRNVQVRRRRIRQRWNGGGNRSSSRNPSPCVESGIRTAHSHRTNCFTVACQLVRNAKRPIPESIKFPVWSQKDITWNVNKQSFPAAPRQQSDYSWGFRST